MNREKEIREGDVFDVAATGGGTAVALVRGRHLVRMLVCGENVHVEELEIPEGVVVAVEAATPAVLMSSGEVLVYGAKKRWLQANIFTVTTKKRTRRPPMTFTVNRAVVERSTVDWSPVLSGVTVTGGAGHDGRMVKCKATKAFALATDVDRNGVAHDVVDLQDGDVVVLPVEAARRHIERGAMERVLEAASSGS